MGEGNQSCGSASDGCEEEGLLQAAGEVPMAEPLRHECWVPSGQMEQGVITPPYTHTVHIILPPSKQNSNYIQPAMALPSQVSHSDTHLSLQHPPQSVKMFTVESVL